MPAARKKLDDELPELPKQAQVGDRIRLKDERVFEYAQACEQAGYSADLRAIRVVTREDKYAPGGGRRLFFEGPPFCFTAGDVTLAWNTEQERREALRAQGWHV